jgi:hypothetical protein
MITIIILIVIYLLSVYLVWRYAHIAYSEDGIWDGDKPDGVIAMLMILPGVNTVVGIIFHFIHSPYENKEYTFLNKLFKLKK